MPRRHAIGSGGCLFHVINRGVRRSQLFFRASDYEDFLRILSEATARVEMRVLGFVLMPNHWHLVLWPSDDDGMTRFVGWASQKHACRWQRVHGTRGLGSVYQGRFRAIPVEPGIHLLTVLRYVERNPVRASLAAHAQDWPYSSASDIPLPDRPVTHPWPIPRPHDWLDVVNEAEPDAALNALRRCVELNAPYGGGDWAKATAVRLGWTSGLRPAGRPKSAKSVRD